MNRLTAANLHLVLVGALICVWSIPNVIAARNILAALALLSLLWCRVPWGHLLRANWPFLLWTGYLLIHLLFLHGDFALAASNFKGEWLHAVAFTVLGLGCGAAIIGRPPADVLLAFGVLFSIPSVIHLSQWGMLYFTTGKAPWGYTGMFPTHGEMGYSAFVAVPFLMIHSLVAATGTYRRLAGLLLTLLAIISPLFAQGRGSSLFGMGAAGLVAFAYWLHAGRRNHGWRGFAMPLLVTVFATACMVLLAVKANPSRWLGTGDRIMVATMGDAVTLLCNGRSAAYEALKTSNVTISPRIEAALDGLESDGGRILAFRVGLEMLGQHPLGIDGAKDAFARAFREQCPAPALQLSHSHNGWIDTALAIGIPGAVLFLLLLVHYARAGWARIRKAPINAAYPLLLFTSAVLWIARSMVDSSQRDHVLEMQCFVLALQFALVRLAEQRTEVSIPAGDRQA